MRNRIFVSIAAYRDAELAYTVGDLLAHAARPEALTVAVLDQNEEALPRPRHLRGARWIFEHCRPSESRGACWARAQVQRHFDGEDFFLQLDAHHIFQPGWDRLLVAELAACPTERAVLTTYLPPYELRNGEPRGEAGTASAMHVAQFDQDGVILYRSQCILRETITPPFPARFFSGHFAFSRREFIERVPYDPELYFMGEESTMAARAFTHGFDLFHPGRTIAWHHYGRDTNPRHWNDHAPATKTPWMEFQRRSLEKYRRIFCLLPHIHPGDGLGTARTLGEYEAWVGVDHYWQVTHPATAALRPPPAAHALDWTVKEGLLAQVDLHVTLPALAGVDPRPATEIHLAILDATSRDGAARRCTPGEYAALEESGWTVRVRYRCAPLRLVVIPFIAGEGWGEKFETHLELPLLPTASPSPRKRSKKRAPRGPARRARRRTPRDV